MPTALISVSNKSGLIEFARSLRNDHNYEIVATGSTAKHLQDNGVDCRTVDSVTEFPEILDGRVKTLHPKIFGGILARNTEEHKKALVEHKIPSIDLVIVNLYPFEKKLTEKLEEASMIEEIDIGGVTLIRAAAKNFDRVSIVCLPEQYDRVLAAYKAGGPDKSLRRELAAEAFDRTMKYDTAISTYVKEQVRLVGDAKADGEDDSAALPERMDVSLSQYQVLRYGENPHQSAVWYAAERHSQKVEKEVVFPPFNQLQGKELSANNIVDTYALVRILRELEGPGACIIKHNNPCGVALGATVREAFDKALATDPVSAFGGIFGFTETVDESLAEEVAKGFVEIVLAPDYTAGALDVFKKKKNVRVLAIKPELLHPSEFDLWHARDLQDFGWIVERSDEPPVEAANFECVTGSVNEERQEDIKFAWGVVKHLTSNAIFIAKNGKSFGFGIGQTSRISSVKIALEQAGEEARGAVMASDAFFPATDNIEAAAAAGISVIVQPGGSIKDKEVIDACRANKIAMLFTGQRCFKH